VSEDSDREKDSEIPRIKERLLDDSTELGIIVSSLKLGLSLADREKRLIWCNKIFEEWFGPLDEIGGKSCEDIYRNKDAAAEAPPLERALKGESVLEALDTCIAKNGKRRWFRLTAIPVKDSSGGVTHALEIRQDITEHKLVEDELEHTERILETIVEGIHVGLVLIDTEGIIVRVNEYMSSLFGLKPGDIIGKRCRIGFKGMPFLCTEYESKKFKNMKDPLERQVKGQLSDGREIILDDIIHPARNARGNLIGFIEIVIDITQRRAMEEKVYEAEKLEALREVVGTVGHEINNPLQIIQNLTDAIGQVLMDRRIRKAFVKNSLRGEFQSIRSKLDSIKNQAVKAGIIGKKLVESVEEFPAEAAPSAEGGKKKPLSKSKKAKSAILVVDDERDIRRFLGARLKREGYRVDTAHCGKEAFEDVKDHHYDVVIADIVMDDMDGCELYDKIKEYDSRIGVILMTGYGYDTRHSIARINERLLAHNLPAVKPIFKPLSIPQLLKRIEGELSRKPG